MENCINCLCSDELDYQGLCESCADKKEFAKVLSEDHAKYMDFDYSMNY
jgi:hypothetical protein